MSDDLMKTAKDLLLPQCPQCSSRFCGPIRCRFSGITHDLFRANEYADEMIRRAKERPEWERDLRQGKPE